METRSRRKRRHQPETSERDERSEPDCSPPPKVASVHTVQQCPASTPARTSTTPTGASAKPSEQVSSTTPSSASAKPSEVVPSTTPSSASAKPSEEVPSTTSTPPSGLVKLWDRTNSEQQDIVRQSERYKDLLNHRRSELTECVDIQVLLPLLRQLQVIDQLTQEDLLLNATRHVSVLRLIEHLERSPAWKLQSFLRALAMTNQQHVLTLLGLDATEYEDDVPPPPLRPLGQDSTTHPPPSLLPSGQNLATQPQRKQHFYKRIESNESIAISNDLLKGLLPHCGSYNQTLMKTCLFGYKKSVPIDLTQIYVCHNPSCKKNQRERLPVGKKELFQRLFGTRCPNCLSIEGPAGTGKSSYLEEYAYNWSQDFTSCEQKGPEVQCTGHLWKLVVYIAAGGIKGTATNSIKENLRCESHLKDQIMRNIEEDGEGVLIEFDALDELHRKDSRDSIASYIQTAQKLVGKPKVLVSARDGLLSVEQRLFDRELHLEGFSLQQGICYMKQYFNEMHLLSSDHPVLQYVEAHPQDLEWVLSNPLRAHILSELTACGKLTCEDLKTLTTIKLFRSLDLLLLKRDRECRPETSHQTTDFFKVCLRCLLTDQRTVTQAEVGLHSPYLSMLKKHSHLDEDFNDCLTFNFPHETLFEYFSMRGLVECLIHDVEYKQAILLWLCSNPKMRNVLQLTCGYIAQYEPALLSDVVFLIRACLILQTEKVWCKKNELTQGLLQLPAVIQETFPPNILTQGLTAQQASTLGGISNQVQAMFSEKADQLKVASWFLNGYKRIGTMTMTLSPFHKFLQGCLQQLAPQQLKDVFSQTVNQLLPCTRLPSWGRLYGVTVVPVAGVRWAAVVETPCVDFFLWSPCDLSSVLDNWRHLAWTQELLQHQIRYSIHIDNSAHHRCTSLPTDPWSEQQWTPGLRKLLSHKYSIHEISIVMGGSTPAQPLGGLLSACRKVLTSRHGLTGGLRVNRGQVTEEELAGFCSWGAEVGLRLKLKLVTVVLREGRGEEDVKNADSTIRRMVEVDVGGERGLLHCPTYMSAEGEVLCERYRPAVSIQ